MNLPTTLPVDASMLYSRNVYNLITHLHKVGMLSEPNPDIADEIARETLVAYGGKIVNPRVAQSLGSILSPFRNWLCAPIIS